MYKVYYNRVITRQILISEVPVSQKEKVINYAVQMMAEEKLTQKLFNELFAVE